MMSLFSITRTQEDDLKFVIDETLKKFHPLVHPTNYRQVFVHDTCSKFTMVISDHWTGLWTGSLDWIAGLD